MEDSYFHQIPDHRTKNWFLVGSFYPVVGILLAYIYLVIIVGPNFMKYRKPYSLKGFIKFYNVLQITLNAVLVFYIMKTGWSSIINFICTPLDSSDNGISLAEMFWYTYMTKIVDLIETIVFVLRKKQRQVSFLHVYHHVSTVIIAWLSNKYSPGGICTLTICLNCTVHVIMYSYYFGSSLNSPTISALVQPIKRYITIIQILQFVILLMHTGQTLTPQCSNYGYVGPIFFGNLLINFILFCNFYQKNYKKKTNTM